MRCERSRLGSVWGTVTSAIVVALIFPARGQLRLCAEIRGPGDEICHDDGTVCALYVSTFAASGTHSCTELCGGIGTQCISRHAIGPHGERCAFYWGNSEPIDCAVQDDQSGVCVCELAPTSAPTSPTQAPTTLPTRRPTLPPTALPSTAPTSLPTKTPTSQPTQPPTRQPVAVPTRTPSVSPSARPSTAPSAVPSPEPTEIATATAPTATPSASPSALIAGSTTPPPSLFEPNPPTAPTAPTAPTEPADDDAIFRGKSMGGTTMGVAPTARPSAAPTESPTEAPTDAPTKHPTTPILFAEGQTPPPVAIPTPVCPQHGPDHPSCSRMVEIIDCSSSSAVRTVCPALCNACTDSPSSAPSPHPSTQSPTTIPSNQPTVSPIAPPTSESPSNLPSVAPTREPTLHPTRIATTEPPSDQLSPQCPGSGVDPDGCLAIVSSVGCIGSVLVVCPAHCEACTTSPTSHPTQNPSSLAPTVLPSPSPSTQAPTFGPTNAPTRLPTSPVPTTAPTQIPTFVPTDRPTSTTCALLNIGANDTVCLETATTCAVYVHDLLGRLSCDEFCAAGDLDCIGRHEQGPIRDRCSHFFGDEFAVECAVQTQPRDVCVCGRRAPTPAPTARPTTVPTAIPSTHPTARPTDIPTRSPTLTPTSYPTEVPTANPSVSPSAVPTNLPTQRPSEMPSVTPTVRPSHNPSSSPTAFPTSTTPSMAPMATPPSASPTLPPTPICPLHGHDALACGTVAAHLGCTDWTASVCPAHCGACTEAPSPQPTAIPSVPPTARPSTLPTLTPSVAPTAMPTAYPSAAPTFAAVLETGSNTCLQNHLCILCSCSTTAASHSRIQCIDAGAVTLPETNTSTVIEGTTLYMNFVRSPIVGGKLLASHLRPWALDFMLISLSLEDNGLTYIQPGAFAVARDLERLEIVAQPGLLLIIRDLQLPSSVTTLRFRDVQVVVSSGDFRIAERRARRQVSGITDLACSNCGLTGSADPAAWFRGLACGLQSLVLRDNNITSVSITACTSLIHLDLSGNAFLDCQASRPWPLGLVPNVRGNSLCGDPRIDCDFWQQDMWNVSNTWSRESASIYVTSGQLIQDSPTWQKFQQTVLDVMNIRSDGPNSNSVVHQGVINLKCPSVEFAYSITVLSDEVDNEESIDKIEGLRFNRGAIGMDGSPAWPLYIANGTQVTFLVGVWLQKSDPTGDTNHFLGNYTLTVDRVLEIATLDSTKAYMGQEIAVPPTVQCDGGRTTKYRVKNGSSIPDGLTLDTLSGYLRGVIAHNATRGGPYSKRLLSVASGEASGMQWIFDLECVDKNDVVRNLPSSTLLIKPPFDFSCPSHPVTMARYGSNVLVPQSLFETTHRSQRYWFSVAPIPGFDMPQGIVLNQALGEAYGTRCNPVNATFFVRVSLGGASKLCPITIRVFENSGISACPYNAEYVDTSGNAFDGVFECRCQSDSVSDEALMITPSLCNRPVVCSESIHPASDGSQAGLKKSLTYGIGIGVLILVFAMLIILARVSRRKQRALELDKAKYWSTVSPAPHLEMQPRDLTLQRSLGSGQFGVVDLVTVDVRHKTSSSWGGRKSGSSPKKTPKGGDFACKRCRGEKITNRDRDEFVAEMSIAVDLDHKNVLKTVGIITQYGPEELCMLTELCSGDMHTFLRDRQPNNLGIGVTQIEMLRFCMETTEGLKYLAAKHFVHRDIATRNLLLTHPEQCVKVADFGLSRRVGTKNYYRKTTNGLLPIRWMAPECITKNYYTPQSDLWSLAVVFWEIFSYADVPYQSMSNGEVVNEVITGYRLPMPRLMRWLSDCRPSLYEVMLACWHEDPQKRPAHGDIMDTLRELLLTSKPPDEATVQNRQQYGMVKRASDADLQATNTFGTKLTAELTMSEVDEDVLEQDLEYVTMVDQGPSLAARSPFDVCVPRGSLTSESSYQSIAYPRLSDASSRHSRGSRPQIQDLLWHHDRYNEVFDHKAGDPPPGRREHAKPPSGLQYMQTSSESNYSSDYDEMLLHRRSRRAPSAADATGIARTDPGPVARRSRTQRRRKSKSLIGYTSVVYEDFQGRAAAQALYPVIHPSTSSEGQTVSEATDPASRRPSAEGIPVDRIVFQGPTAEYEVLPSAAPALYPLAEAATEPLDATQTRTSSHQLRNRLSTRRTDSAGDRIRASMQYDPFLDNQAPKARRTTLERLVSPTKIGESFNGQPITIVEAASSYAGGAPTQPYLRFPTVSAEDDESKLERRTNTIESVLTDRSGLRISKV